MKKDKKPKNLITVRRKQIESFAKKYFEKNSKKVLTGNSKYGSIIITI